MTPVQQALFAMQDLTYRDFQCKLMPTVPPETVIGVRTPDLRRFAKTFAKSPEAKGFLQALPHVYYEENNLHGMLLSSLRDFDRTIAALDAFLPFVDNWATCDLIRPKCFRRHRPALLDPIRRWMVDSHPYTVRFGMEQLMLHFLDDDFSLVYLDWAATVHSEDYYVRMMAAWFFATALTKQYDAALPYLQNHQLDPWVHNKAIQKAIESRCIPAERKEILRTLRHS
jgi:3-methyladenine DNA glycosylase AlkD